MELEAMEDWKVGRLEEWVDNVKVIPIIPLFQTSILPLFQYSIPGTPDAPDIEHHKTYIVHSIKFGVEP